MIDELAIDYKKYLPIRLIQYPELAEFACQQIWDCMSDDIRSIVAASAFSLSSIQVEKTTYFVLIFDFPDYNPLCEVRHLKKLEQLCAIAYQVAGLVHVGAIHRKHGVMAEISLESPGKYILRTF